MKHSLAYILNYSNELEGYSYVTFHYGEAPPNKAKSHRNSIKVLRRGPKLTPSQKKIVISKMGNKRKFTFKDFMEYAEAVGSNYDRIKYYCKRRVFYLNKKERKKGCTDAWVETTEDA